MCVCVNGYVHTCVFVCVRVHAYNYVCGVYDQRLTKTS